MIFLWRQVLSFWNAMTSADAASITNIILIDAVVDWKPNLTYAIFCCKLRLSSPNMAQLRTDAALAGLHRSSNALLSMASPTRWF